MSILPQIIKARICKHCKQEFVLASNVFSNHVRWCTERPKKEGVNSLSLAMREFHNKNSGEIKDFNVFCANSKCGVSFVVREREFKFPSKERYFCSRSCANRRIQTLEVNQKRSVSSRKTWEEKISQMTEEELNSLKNKTKCFTSQGERDLLALLQARLPEYEFTTGGSIAINKTMVQRDIFSKTCKIVIEYDGPWHFVSITGEANLKKKQYKDGLLNAWCIENNYRLIRVSPFDFKKFPELFDNLVDLITNNSDLYQEMYNDSLNKDVRYVLRNITNTW